MWRIIGRDKVLIGQRLESDSICPNQWEPGGKIEEGETPYTNQTRMERRVGYRDISLLIEEKCLGLQKYYGSSIIKYESGKPKGNVHQKVRWITFNEINDYDLTSISKKVLYNKVIIVIKGKE